MREKKENQTKPTQTRQNKYSLQVFEKEVADERDVEALIVSGNDDAIQVGRFARS